MEFIPARKSALFLRIFSIYTRLLFCRRFKNVWLRQEYTPGPNSKTVYFLNHNSWWDGLIPLLLNESRLKQNARALMEDHQMEKYRFFRWLGTFSINREDPRKAITSLRYAVQSMLRERAGLFIYPEGKIKPAGTSLSFEGGLAWLHSNIPDDVDFVPIGVYIHTIRYDKPELHLLAGHPVRPDLNLSNEEKTRLFEQKLESILSELRKTAGYDDKGYELLV